MVKLEEVEDEELEKAQPGPISDDEDDDFVDTDSSLSDSSDLDDDLGPSTISESLSDRILALRDILPPQTRRSISSTVGRTSSTVKSLGALVGKGLWLVSTSTMLIMVPYAIAYVEEQQIVEQEQEMKAQERLQNEMTPGVGGGGGGDARPAGM